MRTRIGVVINEKPKPNACRPAIPPRNCRTHKRLEGDVARPHPAYAKTLLHTTYCAHAFQLPKSKFQMPKYKKKQIPKPKLQIRISNPNPEPEIPKSSFKY